MRQRRRLPPKVSIQIISPVYKILTSVAHETGLNRSISTPTSETIEGLPSDSLQSSQDAPSPPNAGRFTCGLCDEAGIQVRCGRKNDLKRHIDDFHNTNTQWICPVEGCGQSFDWSKAFRDHIKVTHGRSKGNNITPSKSKAGLEGFRVNLCPQTIYACGFTHCQAVFEAQKDEGAADTFKSYVAHVIKHYDDEGNGEWSYSQRVRNLLRQSSMQGIWQSYIRSQPVQTLEWDYQKTSILRKCLETRHIEDRQAFLRTVIELESNNKAPEGTNTTQLTLPVLRRCRFITPGHEVRSAETSKAYSPGEVFPSDSDNGTLSLLPPESSHPSNLPSSPTEAFRGRMHFPIANQPGQTPAQHMMPQMLDRYDSAMPFQALTPQGHDQYVVDGSYGTQLPQQPFGFEGGLPSDAYTGIFTQQTDEMMIMEMEMDDLLPPR